MHLRAGDMGTADGFQQEDEKKEQKKKTPQTAGAGSLRNAALATVARHLLCPFDVEANLFEATFLIYLFLKYQAFDLFAFPGAPRVSRVSERR